MRVVAHRFVEIHRVKNRGIEAGQQFLGYNQNLRMLGRLDEILADLPLFLFFKPILAH